MRSKYRPGRVWMLAAMLLAVGYVASSGLVTQHVDHARRVVDFAVDVAKQVALFNSQYGASVAVRGGILEAECGDLLREFFAER